MPQQAAYSNHPGHTAFSNPQAQGATMVVDQNNLKQHKFEEQKRKLREMSNRGMRSNPKGGKSMVDDFLSKTDLNLSSQPKQGADRGGQDRKTNIFSSELSRCCYFLQLMFTFIVIKLLFVSQYFIETGVSSGL